MNVMLLAAGAFTIGILAGQLSNPWIYLAIMPWLSLDIWLLKRRQWR